MVCKSKYTKAIHYVAPVDIFNFNGDYTKTISLALKFLTNYCLYHKLYFPIKKQRKYIKSYYLKHIIFRPNLEQINLLLKLKNEYHTTYQMIIDYALDLYFDKNIFIR